MSSQRATATESRVRLGVGRGEVAERRVGEHDAEPERVVGPVALVDVTRAGRARLTRMPR